MATRSVWRVGAKLFLASTAAAGGAGAAMIATSDDPANSMKLATTVPVRLFRDSLTAASIVFDYEYSLWGLPEGSKDRSIVKHDVHIRSANKLKELCFRNGGIYIKLGQHLGQLEYLVPEEYVQTMRDSMLNRCPVSTYDQVCEVVKKELGGTPEEVNVRIDPREAVFLAQESTFTHFRGVKHMIFEEFDPVPIASASLAQVHVARTRDGQKVAVKVQHTHMTDTAAADSATVDLIVNTLHYVFPSFDYRWLIDEVRDTLPKELDFLIEAENSVKCLNNFRKLSPHIAQYVYAPSIHWNLTTSRLLTMEFMEGPHVNDVKNIKRLGIRPADVSNLMSQVFAEMMFRHGFVHCDPHAANVLIRPLPSGKWNIFEKKRPQLILLDHGMYKHLDDSIRLSYAALWKGLVFSDAKTIKENSRKLGAGDDLYALFAGILTMRPWERVVDPAVDHLVVKGSDHSELQVYASQYFPQITELLSRLPRVILLMLKTNDCLRTVSNSLGQGSSLETHFIIGRISSEAVIEAKLWQNRSLLTRIDVWFEKLLLEVRLFSIHIALWLLMVRKSLVW